MYPYCRDCCKEYYRMTREHHLQQKKEYAARPEIKERDRQWKKQWYEEHRQKFLDKRRDYYSTPENRKKLIFFKAKERAAKDFIDFSIEIDDIVIPEKCPYLEIPLTHSLGKGQLPSNSSLDRIDSSKGYVKGNVQVISRLANTMKSNATNEQLETFAKNVLHMRSLI